MKLLTNCAILLLVCTCFTAKLHAAPVIYSDLPSFEAATGGSTVIDDYSDSLPFFPTFPLDRGSYTIFEDERVLAKGSSHFILGFGVPLARFEFDSPIGAIGFDYRATSNGIDFEIESGSFSTTATATGTNQFIGIVFDTPVSTVLLGNNPIGNINLDNLRVADAPVPPEPAVPEPASIAVWSLLLLTGVVAVWVRRRRVVPVLN